jgi:hypothetical protein
LEVLRGIRQIARAKGAQPKGRLAVDGMQADASRFNLLPPPVYAGLA